MNTRNHKKAASLAKREYQSHVFLDETTDGEAVYVAIVPEMPGCIAHGDTVEEAVKWLESAKVDHIWFLLDKNLEVPEPQLLSSTLVFNMPQYDDEMVIASASDGMIVSVLSGFRLVGMSATSVATLG